MSRMNLVALTVRLLAYVCVVVIGPPVWPVLVLAGIGEAVALIPPRKPKRELNIWV